jgi:threonylcarbamoyladenosine tRNA methylthiotransferase MtaB
MKYAVITFGCRVNQADSLAMEQDLLSRGATNATPETADLLIVNTCSVTASADQGARHTIRRVVRENPDVKVVVTGCYASRRPDEVSQLPNVTAVIGNTGKESLVADVLGGSGDGPCGQSLEPGVAGRTAFTLRVQTGCEERCSYCVIPQTRGPGRSKPLSAVMDDIGRAMAAGYREIWITGVHLGSYGRDLPSRVALGDLVAQLARVPSDVLFRISSLEPMDCTPEVVDLVAASPRLAPHFHLPLQHGSDQMLRAMQRPYTAQFYQDLVQRIRRLIPHASIGSDVIVGFPGETDGDFDDLRSLLSDLPLTYLHVFPYSDRPGTVASRLRGKLPGDVIRRRGAEIRTMGARMAAAFRASQAGSCRRALVIDDGLSAVTDNYLKVRLPDARPRNSWVDVSL